MSAASLARAIRECCGKTRLTSGPLAIFRLFRADSHLRRSGWFGSAIKGLPVDCEGREIPWFTYSSIAFLERAVDGGMSVFEYGSGHSTIWWGKRVARVVSCEHDAEWFGQMKSKLPSDVEYLHRDLVADGDYSKVVCGYSQEFDIVVIDGRDRINCAKNSLGALKHDGVVVWDNSDREGYRVGYDYLRGAGFRRLDFEGMGPINAYSWCTSIFYRSDNCLGI